MERHAKPSPRIAPLPPEHTPELKDSFEAMKKNLGFVPNSMLILQRKPKIARALAQLSASIWEPGGEIDRGLKRLIAHVASRAAGCQYCMAHTAGGALHFGIEERKLADVWEFRTSPLFSEAERVTLDFAIAAASVPNGVTDEMFVDLRKHWSETQIVEIVAVIATFGFLNRWNDTMGTPLEDEPIAVGEKFLAPHGWSAGKHAPTQTQREGDHRVDPSREQDLAHWSHQLGVTPDELRAAVREAGPRVADLEAHFRARRGPRPGM